MFEKNPLKREITFTLWQQQMFQCKVGRRFQHLHFCDFYFLQCCALQLVLFFRRCYNCAHTPLPLPTPPQEPEEDAKRLVRLICTVVLNLFELAAH